MFTPKELRIIQRALAYEQKALGDVHHHLDVHGHGAALWPIVSDLSSLQIKIQKFFEAATSKPTGRCACSHLVADHTLAGCTVCACAEQF